MLSFSIYIGPRIEGAESSISLVFISDVRESSRSVASCRWSPMRRSTACRHFNFTCPLGIPLVMSSNQRSWKPFSGVTNHRFSGSCCITEGTYKQYNWSQSLFINPANKDFILLAFRTLSRGGYSKKFYTGRFFR